MLLLLMVFISAAGKQTKTVNGYNHFRQNGGWNRKNKCNKRDIIKIMKEILHKCIWTNKIWYVVEKMIITEGGNTN